MTIVLSVYAVGSRLRAPEGAAGLFTDHTVSPYKKSGGPLWRAQTTSNGTT